MEESHFANRVAPYESSILLIVVAGTIDLAIAAKRMEGIRCMMRSRLIERWTDR